MDKKSQNVNFFSVIFAGKLDAWNQFKSCPAGGVHGFGNAVGGVMVSQCDGFQLLTDCQLYHLGRCQRPVRSRRVYVQINISHK